MKADDIVKIPGLRCFWDFQEPANAPRVARGPYPYALREGGRPVARVEDAGAPFGPYAARFSLGHYLHTARRDCPALHIGGPDARLTLVAWLKRERTDYKGCQAVAGIWNEHGKRQYCMFLNLGIWDSREQVGAHVSNVGGPTPGYKYCMDAAIGQTPVSFDEWRCAAITYDGEWARAYLDGRLDERGADPNKAGGNPYRFPGGLYDGGKEDGADFTVGSVTRPQRVDDDFKPHGSIVANPFYGLLGGLAVFNRALSDKEIRQLSLPLSYRVDVRL